VQALALIDPDVIDHRGGVSGDHRGLAAWTEKWEHMYDGLRDVSVTIEHNVASGDFSVNRYTVRGTHAASERRYEVTGLDMVRVHDGRLAEHWALLDSTAMRHQLGALAAAFAPDRGALAAGGVPHRGAGDGLVRRKAGAIVARGTDVDHEHAQHADKQDADYYRPHYHRAPRRPARDDLGGRHACCARRTAETREHRFQPGIGRLEDLLDLVKNQLLAGGQRHLILRCGTQFEILPAG
jgi:predicted ester cyclase